MGELIRATESGDACEDYVYELDVETGSQERRQHLCFDSPLRLKDHDSKALVGPLLQEESIERIVSSNVGHQYPSQEHGHERQPLDIHKTRGAF